jgi:hypothetical protein
MKQSPTLVFAGSEIPRWRVGGGFTRLASRAPFDQSARSVTLT